MIKSKIHIPLYFVFLFTLISACGNDDEPILEVNDGQISFIFQDSIYLINDPWVEKTTDISHTGPDVSVITISGEMSNTHSFTIWVRNYIDEPLDCILETTYKIDEKTSLNEDQCLIVNDNEIYCNAASINYSMGSSTYGGLEGTVSISACNNQLISGTFHSQDYLESGVFKNLKIQ
jgi:hypothetical protein